MATTTIPLSYWDDAFHTVVDLLNRLSTPILKNKSPHKIFSFNKKLDYNFLKVFGCECLPHLRSYNAHKLIYCSLPWLQYYSQRV